MTKKDSKSDEFAVIKTGGKQHIVRVGDVLNVEKLSADKDKVSFDNVLLVVRNGEVKLGEPAVSGAKVEAKLLENGKNKKVTVIRYKAKSRYFKKHGHRQPFSRIEITAIK